MIFRLIRLKCRMLLENGIAGPITFGYLISKKVRVKMRTEVTPMMSSSLRRLLESGESSFFIFVTAQRGGQPRGAIRPVEAERKITRDRKPSSVSLACRFRLPGSLGGWSFI